MTNLLYRDHFGRCSSEMAKLIPLPFSCGKPTYCKKLPGFSPPFQDVARISLSAIIFLFQLDSSIFCLHNVFVTYDPLGFTLELFGTFHLWLLFNYLSYVFFLSVFSSSYNSMSCSWCPVLTGLNLIMGKKLSNQAVFRKFTCKPILANMLRFC